MNSIGNYGLTLHTAPAVEPLSLTEAKKQVEVATAITTHDTHLTNLIVAARQAAEAETHRQIITATWKLILDRFPCDSDEPIRLPFGSLQSVTHVKYYDTDGTQQTWSSVNYIVSTSREPGLIRKAYGVVWPTIQPRPDAVEVQFVCGYGVAAAVPQLLKAGMLLLVGHWFEHREETVVGTISSELPRAAADIFKQFNLGDDFDSYGI